MNKKRNIYLICFLAAFVPRLFFLQWSYPLNISVDEFSLFLPVAKALNWDWSSMILKPLYYGYGFIYLLIPLFKWIEDPIFLYRVIVVFMMLAQALAAPIAVYAMKRFFLIKNEIFTCLTAIACSYLVTQRAVYVYNEFIYVLVMWVILVLLLCLQKAQHDKWGKRKYSVLLAAAMGYALTLHTRAITVFLALGVLCVLYYWLYRKHIIDYLSFGIIGALGYVVSNIAKGNMIASLFHSNIGKVSNSSVDVSAKVLGLSSRSMTGMMDIILGEINSMLIITCGIAMLCVVIACIFIWKTLKRDKEFLEAEESENYQAYVITFIFFLSATAMTILGQSLLWLPPVAETLNTGVQNDGLRALTYVRYYGAYFGPVVLAGIAYAYQYKDKVKKLLYPSILIVAVLQGLWMFYVVPYIIGFGECSFDSAVYSLRKGWTDDITFHTYWPAAVAAIVGILLFSYFYKKNRMQLAVGMFACVLIYGYCYQAINYEGFRGVENFKSVDDSYDILQSMEEEGILPHTIYTQDSSAKTVGHSTGSIMQFLFQEHKIVPKTPSGKEKEGIFLTGEFYEYPELTEQGYECAQIDQQEFIYVKGKELQAFMKQLGIPLSSYLDYQAEIELNKFNSDFTAHRSIRQIQSDGTEGYLFHGYKYRFGGGKLTTILELELIEARQDLLGTFEFARDNGEDAILGHDVYASDFDEDGKLTIKIPVSCAGNEVIEQRMTAYEGAQIKVKSVKISKDSNYEVGRNTAEEVTAIKEKLPQLPISGKLYYVEDTATCKPMTGYLENELGRTVTVITLEELRNHKVSDQNAIYMTEGYQHIFEIADNYPIWMKTKGFTVFTKQAEVPFSDQNGIRMTYFQGEDQGSYNSGRDIRLTKGTYEITAMITAEKDKKPSNTGIEAMDYGQSLGKAEFVQDKDNPQVYTAKLQISTKEGYRGLKINYEYSYAGASYVPTVYIRQAGEEK